MNFRRLWLEIQRDRAVVGSFDETMDFSGLDGGFDSRTGDHIVQAPTHILLTCTSAVAPPRIGHLFRMHLTPGIDEIPFF